MTNLAVGGARGNRRVRRYYPVAVAMIAILLSGSSCKPSIDQLYGKEATSETHDEAATTHVAVLSVAPWSDVAASLQPSFKLTTADAYAQAIPVTQAIEEKLVEAFMLKLGLGLPRTSLSATDTVTESSVVNRAVDAAGNATNTSQSSTEETSTATETKEPGQVPTPTLPTGAPSALTLPGIGVTGTKISDDPFLRYAAATALFQEAALLDQYVKNAAKRSGYVPYLVRMQLSVLAHKRNQPYDIYADMSFFLQQQLTAGLKLPNRTRVEHLTVALSEAEALVATAHTEINRASNALKGVAEGTPLHAQAVSDQSKAKQALADAQQLKDRLRIELQTAGLAANLETVTAAACEAAIADGNVPEIIPLLSTDNLEAALRSKAIDRLSQFALALNLMMKGVGAQVDSNASIEDFAAVIGKDMNSLFTVAKMNGNTIRARIGAMNQIETRYAALSRTHNVSALVMVPKAYAEVCDPAVTIVAQTSMRHGKTGEILPPVRSKEYWREVDDLYAGWYVDMKKCVDKKSAADRTKFENEMDAAILNGNFTEFDSAITKACSDVPKSDRGYLWQDLLSLLQSFGASQVTFSVPYKKDQQATLPPEQIALLLDTGAAASVRLQGASQIDASVMAAAVQQSDGTQTKPLLVAQSVARDGSALVAQFSSPSLWKLEYDPKQLYLSLWNTTVAPPNCTGVHVEDGVFEGRPTQIYRCYSLTILQRKDETAPKVTIVQSATTIVGTDKAEGSVKLGAELPKGTKLVRFSPKNAEIVGDRINLEIRVDDGQESVATSLALRNLDVEKDVIIKVEALDAAKKVIAAETATFQVKLPEPKKTAE